MIGLFDSGHGGLTVFAALVARFPDIRFLYLGDHANAPYGNRPAEDVVALTQAGVERLFGLGCRLVILACNTATAVACRTLQRSWLPDSGWVGHNVIGIVAPTVEAATQTPWAVQTPQYPQKFNRDRIAVFGTQRTIASGVYPEEIRKRCPQVTVIQQACPDLATAIERARPDGELAQLVEGYVAALLAECAGQAPDRAILGCTHYPLVQEHFRRFLPPATRILAQPEAVAHSLDDYLARHPHYAQPRDHLFEPVLLTTGNVVEVTAGLRAFMPHHARFRSVMDFDPAGAGGAVTPATRA
ncbi:MAG: glutamate racemase [Rhizobiales bacterium]|nr:glutamate racemase [Hyphomicrobiales bacterium]